MFDPDGCAGGTDGWSAAAVVDPDESWWTDLPVRDEPSWLGDVAAGPDGWLVTGTVRQRLEWVCGQRPSSVTWQALDVLAQEPMGPAEKVLFARAWDRQANAAAGMATAALADAVGPDPRETDPDAVDLAVTEAQLALGTSPGEMRGQAGFARRLAAALPATLERWCAGVIPARKVHALVQATLGLPDAATRRIDARLAGKAERVSTTWLRQLARRAAESADARSPDERHAEAKREQRAVVEPAPDGMAWLSILMTAPDAVAALEALNRRADAARTPQDLRSHGERQVATLLDLLFGAPLTGDGTIRRDRRTDVHALVDLPSLLGLRDVPAHLPGYGPIPNAAIRDLLTHPGTTLRRLVTDPITGTLLDYGHARYRPDENMLELIRATERTCRFPGCPRPGWRCDCDHCVAFNHAHPETGGETSTRNCHLLCRHHHRLKTHHGYHYTVDHTGAATWTTPHGFTYTDPPPTYDEFLDPPPDPPPDG